VALLTVLPLFACGGGEASSDARPEVLPLDTTYTPLLREPLTDADLAGLVVADLVVELPWTTNRVSRGASEHAPRASLRAAEVSGHDGFDRVVFRFSDTTPFPGYEIERVASGHEVQCGEEGEAYTVAGDRALVVRLTPARLSEGDESFLPLGLSRISQSRIQEAGAVCEAHSVVWVATLADGEQVRVLELRGPNRLVVDVR
jgi:hypothetical protein